MMTKPSQLPKYDDFFKPTLEALRELGGSASIEELEEALVVAVGLTQEQLDVVYPRSGAAVALDRMSWARSFLKLARLVENPKRGVWILSEEGRSAVLKSTTEIKKLVAAAYKASLAAKKASQDTIEEAGEERDGQSIGWSDQLLLRLQAVEPSAFERLCQRLLRESGFTKVE